MVRKLKAPSNGTAETLISMESSIEIANLSSAVTVNSYEGRSGESIGSASSAKAHSKVVTSRDQKRWASSKKQMKGILAVKVDKPSPETQALDQARRRRRKNLLRHGVRFGTIEIREHPIIVGDNPGGFRGPPLTIEWKPQNRVQMPLEEYERDRPPRRTGSQMNIPFSVRESMLRDAGYTRGELREALRDVTIARRHRRRTIETMKLATVHEIRERVIRASLNMTLRRGSKKKEREYIKKAWKVHNGMEEVESRSQNSEVSESLPSMEDFEDLNLDDDTKEYPADASESSKRMDESSQSHTV